MADEDLSIYEVALDDGSAVAVADAPPPAPPKAKAKKAKAAPAPVVVDEPLLEAPVEEVVAEIPEPVEEPVADEVDDVTPQDDVPPFEEPAPKDTTGGGDTLRQAIEATDVEADIEPIEPMEEEKPATTRVGSFKKADKLDEAALEKALEYTEVAHQQSMTIQEGWKKDPLFRLATLEHWDRDGSLDQRGFRGELESLRVKVGPQRETPKPAAAPKAEELMDPAVIKQALALRAANKDDEADMLIATAGAELGERRALAKMRAEIEPLKASDAERRANMNAAQQRQEQEKVNAAAVKTVREECVEFAKTYPKLVSFDEKTGKIAFKCKKFAEGFAKNYGASLPLKLIAKTTLVEQGRFGKPKTAAPAPKVASAPVLASPGKVKKKASDDELVIEVGS